jgi:hypothetical protein
MIKAILPILLILFATPVWAGSAVPFFAMDTIARGAPDEVVPMLKDLGFDGLGGAAGDDRMARAIEAAGMRFFNGYFTVSFDSAQPALDHHLRGALDRMQGHDTALWLAVQKVQRDGMPLGRSLPEADEIAVAKLREIANYARSRGVRVSFMEKVWAAGYTGPVGFQGFGIKRDSREVLAETMAAWRKIIGQR